MRATNTAPSVSLTEPLGGEEKLQPDSAGLNNNSDVTRCFLRFSHVATLLHGFLSKAGDLHPQREKPGTNPHIWPHSRRNHTYADHTECSNVFKANNASTGGNLPLLVFMIMGYTQARTRVAKWRNMESCSLHLVSVPKVTG